MRKKKQIWNRQLTDLCWNNFCETGEIGHYMLYKKVKENGTKAVDKGAGSSSDKLSGE